MVSEADQAKLADRAEELSTDVLLARLAVGHDALAGRNDRDAHPVQDAREVADAAVDPPARLARAVDLVDDLLAGHRVLQLDADLALLGVIDDVVVFDVALVLEHLCDAGADLALGDEDHSSADPVCVPD